MIVKKMASMSALSLFRNAVQFSMNIVMARFVSPAEFGLLVFTTPFLAFIALMTDMGLSSAMVRGEALTARQVAGAFTVTLLLGLVMAIGLACAALPIQEIVHMRGLAPVMAAMAGVVLLSTAAVAPRALLERDLQYGRIAGVEGVAVLASAASGLCGIALGWGIWALVAYNLLNQALRAVSFGWISRSALRLDFRWKPLVPLLSFGGWILATNILTFFVRNSDNLLIGAVLGAAALGVYGMGYQFMMIPMMAITWPASSVLFAMLSRQTLEPERMRQTLRGVLSATAALTVPAMTYLSFGLYFPVHAVLSSRWSALPAILSWLAPLGALQSIASYSGVVLTAAGRPRLQFLLTLINGGIIVSGFVLSVHFGLFALIRTYVAISLCTGIATILIMIRATPIAASDVAHAVTPPILASLAGLALARMVSEGTDFTGWIAMTATFGATVLVSYGLMSRQMRRSVAVLVAAPSAVA